MGNTSTFPKDRGKELQSLALFSKCSKKGRSWPIFGCGLEETINSFNSHELFPDRFSKGLGHPGDHRGLLEAMPTFAQRSQCRSLNGLFVWRVYSSQYS